MYCSTNLEFTGTVEHTLYRADGTIQRYAPDTRVIYRPKRYLHALWLRLRANLPYFAGMSYVTFLEWQRWRPQHGMLLHQICADLPMVGIVTGAGINYLATLFTTSANPLLNMNYHTYGTGDVHGATSTPTGATAATPSVVTQASHPFQQNDIIKLTGITGITGINGIWQLKPVVITAGAGVSYTLLGSVGGGSGFGGGTNAAQLLNGQADTALTTEVPGLTRVAGTQTNLPSSNNYKTTVAVTFTGATVPPSITIIEWGLLSALTTGTLWDRRWMNTVNSPSTDGAAALVAAPITITATGDSINTTYTLTCTAGGS